MNSVTNISFCIIHRYWRWEEILASERALQTGWIGSCICITQPIFDLICCIWEAVVENFTPSVFTQGDFNTVWLLEFLELCLPPNITFWSVWGWPVFDLREIGSIASSVQVVLVLCQRFYKTSIHNLSEFSKDTPLSSNISLPEIFHYEEQWLLLWSWCLDYFCLHLSFSCLLDYPSFKDIPVNLWQCNNQTVCTHFRTWKKYIQW